MNFIKSAVKILTFALCTAILVLAGLIMLDRVQEQETKWEHMKIFVESTDPETAGQIQSYNDKHSQLMKVRYTNNFIFILTEDGQQYPYPRDRFNVWYVRRGGK